jgi:hypothetical protein
MTATAEATVTPQAPPAAEQAAAPPAPFSASDLHALQTAGPKFEAGPAGARVSFWVPPPERDWVRQVHREADDLERPLHEAAAAALAGADHVEYLRRAQALRSAQAQQAYFEQRLGQLRAERTAALARGGDPGQAEANLQQAQGELERFRGRASALSPLVEAAQARAAAVLHGCVNDAHRQVVARAAAAVAERRRALVAAFAELLVPLLKAQFQLERVQHRATVDRLGELPPEEKKGA